MAMNNDIAIAGINRYIVMDYMYIKERVPLDMKDFTTSYSNLKPVILYGLSDVEKDIPSFNHPIINEENNWIALDLRNFVTPDKNNSSYSVRNESEYTLALYRYILTAMWYTGNQSTIHGFKLPHFAFASWLSDSITRKFGLDLSNQLQLRVLALMYYSTMFNDTFTDDDVTKLIIRGREDSIIPEIVNEIVGKVGKVNSIDDFTDSIYTVTGNIRVQRFDYSVLANIVNTSWSGNSGKELILLSLEHPPTWISLVAASLTQRSFRKSQVATVVERLSNRGRGDAFLKELKSVTSTYTSKV